MKLLKKTALAGVLGFSILGTSSCLGPNNVFNNLTNWNRELTENKWLNELAFIGLNIIPVYGFAYLGDIIIFNSIEFWAGPEKNPIQPNE